MFIDRAKAVKQSAAAINAINISGASIEWIGTKIQKTPGIMREAGFIFHHDLNVTKPEFNLDLNVIKADLKAFFRNYIVEGLIVRHPRSV